MFARFHRVVMPLMQDPIVPGDPAPSPPAPAGDHNSLRCEFCDSILARNGQVLRVGARAKKLRDLEDEIEDRDAIIRERDTTITDLRRELAEALAKLPKVKEPGGEDW